MFAPNSIKTLLKMASEDKIEDLLAGSDQEVRVHQSDEMLAIPEVPLGAALANTADMLAEMDATLAGLKSWEEQRKREREALEKLYSVSPSTAQERAVSSGNGQEAGEEEDDLDLSDDYLSKKMEHELLELRQMREALERTGFTEDMLDSHGENPYLAGKTSVKLRNIEEADLHRLLDESDPAKRTLRTTMPNAEEVYDVQDETQDEQTSAINFELDAWGGQLDDIMNRLQILDDMAQPRDPAAEPIEKPSSE
eukprot:GILK01003908.1.p1 GENE.GILK01003908.1~~GILK01003908.1.p1  ORF type:complete len:253 (-),score=52.80 GILK01003908.1:181-939(-)